MSAAIKRTCGMFAERSDPSVVAKTGMEFEEKKPKTRSVRYNSPAYDARIPTTTRIQARLAVLVHTMMARKDAAAPNNRETRSSMSSGF